jgi:thioesterase domain-containing protein
MLELAGLLGPDQPLFSVTPHGIGDEPIPNSIEAMAHDRYSAIVKAQPEGPYRLGGYCASGLVAFEAARLLVAAGKQVEMVVMIDPPTVNAARSMQLIVAAMNRTRSATPSLAYQTIRWTFRTSALFNQFRNLPLARRGAFLRDNARKIVERGEHLAFGQSRKSGRPNAPASAGPQLFEERNSKYSNVVFNYVPRPLAVPVVYFSVEYGLGAWKRISADVEVVKLPGAHGDIDLVFFADDLRRRLRHQG